MNRNDIEELFKIAEGFKNKLFEINSHLFLQRNT